VTYLYDRRREGFYPNGVILSKKGQRGNSVPVKVAVELVKKGRAFAIRGRHRDALRAYEKAIALDTSFAGAWLAKAETLIDLQQFKEALSDCDRAIALDQNYADAWSKKGLCLYSLEQFDEAVASCTRALALNGNDPFAWYIKGVSLDELGKSNEAEEAYGKSLELEIILDMEAEKKKAGR
jgi:Flp pilus assembly protein TadD